MTPFELLYEVDAPAPGQIYHGDCRAVLNACADTWRGQFDFVFADPPFNIGHGYDVYNDKQTREEFDDFMREWLYGIPRILRPGGILAIHVPWQLLYVVLSSFEPSTNKAVFELEQIQHIIWHYRFGENQTTRFTSSHCHCLIYKRAGAAHTFNSEAVLVPSDRATKYNDARAFNSATPGLRLPLDVWSVENDGAYWGRVPGNSKERLANHPNQLPEVYLSRLLSAYTNPGDLVFDPFGGTGTTFVVAGALECRRVTCDVSRQYCEDILKRDKKGAIRV